MPVCHFCTPEEDHIDRNIVYILKILEFCPEISVACLDYNFLQCLSAHVYSEVEKIKLVILV